MVTSYQHSITELKTTLCPIETIGGIIADDMGLGKTLTVISTIIRTAHEAKLFAASEDDPVEAPGTKEIMKSPSQILSRSTLVIVPSSCKLKAASAMASSLANTDQI
jgi:SWI/SNF-related matrix-associated actin-dependent regulator of chromatin subfamily A3